MESPQEQDFRTLALPGCSASSLDTLLFTFPLAGRLEKDAEQGFFPQAGELWPQSPAKDIA